jgi:hypothetical protein
VGGARKQREGDLLGVAVLEVQDPRVVEQGAVGGRAVRDEHAAPLVEEGRNAPPARGARRAGPPCQATRSGAGGSRDGAALARVKLPDVLYRSQASRP